MTPRATLATSAAVLALSAIALAAVPTVTPTIRPAPRAVVHHPKPAPTTGNGGTARWDVDRLIIQQEVNCWIGVPGVTCGDERTYL